MPLLFFVEWPRDPYFYLYLVLAASLFSFQEAEALTLSRRYGGMFLSITGAFFMSFTFVLWFLIDESSWQMFLNSGWVKYAVFGALVLSILSQLDIRKKQLPDYKRAVNHLILLAAVGACSVVCVKLGMDHAPKLESAFVWSCLLNLLIAGLAFGRHGFRVKAGLNTHQLFEKRLLQGGIIIGVTGAISAPAITLAFAGASNPVFANFVAQFQLLWLYMYCIFSGKPVNVRPAGLVMAVVAALVMIYCSGYLQG